MTKKAIEKGTPYFDQKEKTISYILNHGFISGKSLQVSVDPHTGKIITAIRRKEFNPNVEFNKAPRFVRIVE